MDVEQQARILRAMRAWLGMEQGEVARFAGLGERSLLDAEKGRSCSAKTWLKLTEFYASRGLHWREGDRVEAARIMIQP